MQITPINTINSNFKASITVNYPKYIQESRSINKATQSVKLNANMSGWVYRYILANIVGKYGWGNHFMHNYVYENLLDVFENNKEIAEKGMILPHAYRHKDIKLKDYFLLGWPEHSSSMVEYTARRNNNGNLVFKVGNKLIIVV